MGRIFEKRKGRMFARWAKMAKAFTKIGKELSISVKLGGADPVTNPRLRMAIQTARSLNMPKDRIEAAINRANSRDAVSLDEIVYEGYGPHGVALVIETATDNQTRTVANVRSAISRWGGSLASSGALDYIFERKGVFVITPPGEDIDELELFLIDHGLEELFESDDGLILYSNFNNFGELQKALESKHIEVKSASPQRIPANYVELTGDQQSEINKLVDALEDDDDVQHVYHNMKVEEI